MGMAMMLQKASLTVNSVPDMDMLVQYRARIHDRYAICPPGFSFDEQALPPNEFPVKCDLLGSNSGVLATAPGASPEFFLHVAKPGWSQGQPGHFTGKISPTINSMLS
jgi:hypothetical protein